jgi:hypothetical protein
MINHEKIIINKEVIQDFSRQLNHELRTPFAVVNTSLSFIHEIIISLVNDGYEEFIKKYDKEYLKKVAVSIDSSSMELKNAEDFLIKITAYLSNSTLEEKL